MFRWASPQPISTELEELLAQAGGCRSGPGEDPEVSVFLPPHLLLAPRDGRRGRLDCAYAGLDGGEPPGRLVNGERLLGLRPAEIAHWLLGHPLQRPLGLAAVDPLLAAVTLAALEGQPELVHRYQGLDARSERGGAAAEQTYRQRLRPSAAALLAGWDALGAPPPHPGPGEPGGERQQMASLARELEQQLIETHRGRELAEQQRQTNRRLRSELRRTDALRRRLMALQGRLLGSSSGRIRP